jgi:hypothetical protein
MNKGRLSILAAILVLVISFSVLSATAYREAQVNLFQSKLAVQSAKFDLKMAELELMRLSGRLLTEGS